jgi:hypothetical protein
MYARNVNLGNSGLHANESGSLSAVLVLHEDTERKMQRGTGRGE